MTYDAKSQQSTVQSKASQKASGEDANASTDNKTGRTFTQDEWNKMQSNYQKQIRDLNTSLKAAQGELDDLKDTNEGLKDKVVSLQSEEDEGYPTDAKEALEKIRKREETHKKEVRDYKKERTEWDTALAQRDDEAKVSIANELAGKYGVDADVLLGFDSTEKMKVYALDNMDLGKLKPVEEQKVVSPKNPPPVIPISTPSGNWRDMSAEDRVSLGLKQKTK